MNTNALISISLAALCIIAVGVSSTTLASSLSTDPDDVIDLNYERLPLSQDAVKSWQDEVNGNEKRQASANQENPDGERRQEPQQKQAKKQVTVQKQQRKQKQVTAIKPVPAPPTPLERLLSFLRDLLPWLALAGLLAAVAVLASRYRDRFAVTFGSGGDGGDDERWPTAEPANDVDRAWLAMIRRLDADHPRSRTPADWADAAIQSGMNPEAVTTLTRTFEQVHYGGAPVTDTRRRRARQELRRLDVATDGGEP